MTSDRKKLYLISASVLIVLLATLLVPNGSGRIIAAILLLPSAIATVIIIKKRVALSIYSKQVLLIVSTIGLLYVMLYFVSALKFGFIRTGYGLRSDIIFKFIIPIAVIIVATELIRHVLCAQKKASASVFAYFICLVADVIICATIPSITNSATFMDVVGLTLFPGLLYNLLFNYLSVRYGYWPNIVYRALTVWVFYLIPYGSAVSDSLLAFINVMLPIAIYLFIDALYEKKRKYALRNTSRAWRIVSGVLTVVVVIIMTGTVMLISNHFRYGSLVIATESMTGELNKGDVAIFESYADQEIEEGQVIVFEKGKSMIVHRVVDIEIINGNTRYYTKGDANEDNDAGFITDADIVGLVNNKVPYVGYPTIWLKGLFSR